MSDSQPSSPPRAPNNPPANSLTGRRRLPEQVERFNLPPLKRILTFSLSAYTTGFALGSVQGGRQAALRFRAENSHRLPTNTRGWYFYHKAKHAYVGLASVGEAHRMGKRLVPWVALMVVVEDLVDSMRLDEDFDDTRKDFCSTAVAGVTVAGAFSVWNKVPIPTAARVARTGLIGGLTFGLLQDGLRLLQGHKLLYVEVIKRRFGYGTACEPESGAEV